MPTRTNATTPPGIVLQPRDLDRLTCWEHVLPAESLASRAGLYWSISWDFPTGAEHRQFTVPDVEMHLSFEWGDTDRDGADRPGAYLTGPLTRRFAARLHGVGGVLGIKLRAGALPTLTGIEAASLRDRTVPASSIWPHPLPELRGCASEQAEQLDGLLSAIDWPQDPRALELQQLVDYVRAERTLTRVEDIAGTSVRALQRSFRYYLGVTPKWLIKRSRIHDAVAMLNEGYPGSLADLSVELGLFDQAHFNQDFRSIVGQTPGAYRKARQE